MIVPPETLVRVCAALGAPVVRASDAAGVLRERRAGRERFRVPPVFVCWDGKWTGCEITGARDVRLILAEGSTIPLRHVRGAFRMSERIPDGYHRLSVSFPGHDETATVIAAPRRTWRREATRHSWGVGAHLAACRSSRSRSLGDVGDLVSLCEWVRSHGGDLVTLLPLLPTFNSEPAEPSPYSPVSRLFWSELMLDLGDKHRPVPPPSRLDVSVADAEVRSALRDRKPLPSDDEELRRYAKFRGAQRRLGRNWRSWPATARGGVLTADDIEPDEERFHLVAQQMAHAQLDGVRRRFDGEGFRLGLDLAVGVHPDGYDPWSRQALFANGMSVGAPPDLGFPSGQDWGFSPVLPDASRLEGHRYLARSIAHQAELAGVLRIDHIMAWSRLYWIPHGFGLDQGTYVTYPADELFAVLSLESHAHRCEIVGENLGTVPKEIEEALTTHGIRGMYLAQFSAASGKRLTAPAAHDVALVGTHDTPTFAGWLAGHDIEERVRHGLLKAAAAPRARMERARAAENVARKFGVSIEEPRELLFALLHWLARSKSSLIVPWLEDFWLEEVGVNLPGTRSSERPNWQRPMRRLLDEIAADADLRDVLASLTYERDRK